MPRPIHFRVAGESATRSNPTACLLIGFNVPDTDAVTCPQCRVTEIFILTHARHAAVIEALASPKEHHPCLSNHQPPTS